MKEDEQTNKERYGSFLKYAWGNRQKRRWLLFTHGFALAWGLVGWLIEGAPVGVCLLATVIPAVWWVMSHRNYTGKTV